MPEILSQTVPGDQLTIGLGFNSVSGQPGGLAVTFQNFDDLAPATPGAGLRSTYTLKVIESLHDLRTTLNISASASVGLGIYSGDAAGSYYRSQTINEFSNFIFVDVVVLGPSMHLKRRHLTQAAVDACNDGYRRFLPFCGDRYVEGFQTGGRLTAIAQFESRTQLDFEKVTASVHAAVADFGSGGGSFERTLTELSRISRYSLTVMRNGTSDRIPDMKGLVEAANRLPEQMGDETKRVAVNVFLANYASADNYPWKTSRVDLDLLERQSQTLNLVATSLDTLYQEQGNLQYVKSHIEQFQNDGTLARRIDEAFRENDRSIQALLSFVLDLRHKPDLPAPELPKVATVKPERIVIDRPTTPVVKLYEHTNFGGRAVELTTSAASLQPWGLNDQVSSIDISGGPGEYLVELYRDDNFGGPKIQFLSPSKVNLTDYPLGIGTWHDTVSSVRIIKKQ